MTRSGQNTAVYERGIGVGVPTELEAAAIAEFQDVLQGIQVRPLTVEVDVDRLDPVAEAKADFFREELQPRSTFYALAEISHELTESLTGFEPYVSGAGKSSRHGVFFGALLFADDLRVEVAVKPHATDGGSVQSDREAETSCLDDYFTNIAARKCGFESLEPVGFVLGERGLKYSLTVLDDDLKSLDSAEWTRFFDPGYETVGMRDLLARTALKAALIHDMGGGDSYHGDFRFANIATNPHGHVFPFDWEKGKLSKAAVKDPEEHFGRVWRDIATFMKDMIRPTNWSNPGVGLFKECSGDWWENFCDIFLNDYVDSRRILAHQGSHHMRRVQETEDELAQLEHVLQLEMDGWHKMLTSAS